SWTGGTVSGSSTLTANSGIDISGSALKTLDTASISNAATATWTGTGDIAASNGAVFTNVVGATFDIQNNQQFTRGTGAMPTFVNAGTLLKSAGTGQSFVTTRFHNSGSVTAQTGQLSLGAGTSSGSFGVLAGATLGLSGVNGSSESGTLTGASSVSGAGTVMFSGTTTNVNGAYNVTGSTDVEGGTANFSAAITSVGSTFSVGLSSAS